MLHLSRTADSHEDLFIQRYQALVAWALRLCDNDRQHAEDLVQDAFVAFTLSRPDLAVIENLDGYLRGMLRKLQVSRIRRAANGAGKTLSLLDQDSAELGLRAVGAATVEATEELACVCRYACLRKGSSKAGSILILRFFHGYFPSEIAQIARCTPHAVDDWLRIARREACIFREEPQRLRFLKRPQPSAAVDAALDALAAIRTGDPAECLLALRAAIFHAHDGRCFTHRELADVYVASRESREPRESGESGESLEASRLAHIVSCRRCLERINVLLDLGSLDDRSPHDMLGPGGSAGAGGSRPAPKRAPRIPSAGSDRLWRTAYEHRASELRIVVNGFLVGTHTVGRALTRQSVAVTLDEPIGFVEVFGEHDVRLAFLDVQPAPDGLVDQSVSAHLSEERRLQVRVSFARPFPEVHVEYEDPHWQPADVVADDSEVAPREAHRASLIPLTLPSPRKTPPPLPAGEGRGEGSGWPVRGVPGRPRWAFRWRFAMAVLCLALYGLLAPAGTTAWAAQQVGRALSAVTRELMALPQRIWGRPPLASRTVAPIAGLQVSPESPYAMSSLLPTGGGTSTPAMTAAFGPERQARVAIDVLSRLDGIGALLGGQIDVAVAPRAIVVSGLVDDESRRREMLRALGPLQRDRMVQVDLVTVAERLRQQQARSATSRVLYRPIEFPAAGIPVGTELRAYLTRYPEWTHAGGPAVEAEVRRIATAGLRRSRAALLHAVLLQSLAERYDAAALQALDARAYETWRSLLVTHAAAFAEEVGGVRELLRPAFLSGSEPVSVGNPPTAAGAASAGAAAGDSAADADIRAGDVALNRAAARIGTLAIEIDDAIRAGLSTGPERAESLRIKDAAFWRTVAAAERLARTLGR